MTPVTTAIPRTAADHHATTACAWCGHDDAEHHGGCRRDLYVARTWAKCSCTAFAAVA